jgi:hypothetical protein
MNADQKMYSSKNISFYYSIYIVCNYLPILQTATKKYRESSGHSSFFCLLKDLILTKSIKRVFDSDLCDYVYHAFPLTGFREVVDPAQSVDRTFLFPKSILIYMQGVEIFSIGILNV